MSVPKHLSTDIREPEHNCFSIYSFPNSIDHRNDPRARLYRKTIPRLYPFFQLFGQRISGHTGCTPLMLRCVLKLLRIAADRPLDKLNSVQTYTTFTAIPLIGTVDCQRSPA